MFRSGSPKTLRANFPPSYMSSSGRQNLSSFSPAPSALAPTDNGLQPYLGLRARTSLAWLGYPILILVLIIIQLIITLQSIHDGVGDAKREMAGVCSGVEGAASVAISIPHFMADQTNDLLVSGAENIVHGLAIVIDLSVKAIEAIILYVIDTYRSLYLCLAEFVVRASLALLIAAAEEAEKVFTEAVHGIRDAIQSTIGGAEKALSEAIKDLNKLPLVHITQPNLTIPELGALENFKMPTGLSDALIKLNTSLPTLGELRDTLDKLVTTPFEAMRLEATSKLSNATIDRNLLKVPPLKKVEFCQDIDTSFIDTIGKIIADGVRFIILGILGAIVLITLFNIVKERFLWRRMMTHLQRSREAWLNTSANNFSTPALLCFVQSMKTPFVSQTTRKFCKKSKSGSYRSAWFVAYLTWPAALLFLGAGILGIAVVEVQLAAIHGLRNRAVQEANAGVGGFANLVTDKINHETANMSAAFANDTNTVILHFQSDINDHMLGWAGTTTTTLNNTLVSFYDELTKIVNATFGNTPLRDASLELLQCLIGSKVAGIEKALTFVHDHAHVDLPTVSPTVLMITPHQTQALVGSMASTDPAISSDPNGPKTVATNFVDRLLDRYVKALNKQRITYIALLVCYLIVIIFGTIGVIWDALQEKGLERTLVTPAPLTDEKSKVAGLDVFKVQHSTPPYTVDQTITSKAAIQNSLIYPPPPPSFPITSLPLPPAPPSFLEIDDEPHEFNQPVSKFSPITPNGSPISRWPGSKSKK